MQLGQTTRYGFVYFASAMGTPFIKIGFSTHPESRVRSLQGGCPYEIRLLGQAHGSGDHEKELHKWLDRQRIRGEWFEMSEAYARKILEYMPCRTDQVGEVVQVVARRLFRQGLDTRWDLAEKP